MYYGITLDLCDNCNAQCAYCKTGRGEIQSRRYKFIDVEELIKTFDYLLSNNLYDKETSPVFLFRWGEPTLHPQFKEILRILRNYSNNVVLSSNFSKRITFNAAADDLSHLKDLVISMPGFSQASYDKIHKFNFETIKSNVSYMIKNMRECGYTGGAAISFHLYQFNLGEYIDALDFAIDNEVGLVAYFAIFADFNVCLKLFGNELSDRELKDMRKHLLYDPRYDEGRELPPSFECRPSKYLTLDIDFNVINCCADSSVYKKVYDLDEKGLIDWRMNLDVCKKCKKSGLCYYYEMREKDPNVINVEASTVPYKDNELLKLFPKINDRIIQRMSKHKIELKTPDLFFESKKYKNIAIYGCGTLGKYLYSELKNTGINVSCFIDNGPTAAESFDGKAVVKNDGINKYAFDAVVLSAQPGDYAYIIKTLKNLTSAPIVKMTDILKFNDSAETL